MDITLRPRAPKRAGAMAPSRAGPKRRRARRAPQRTRSGTACAPKNSSCCTTRTPQRSRPWPTRWRTISRPGARCRAFGPGAWWSPPGGSSGPTGSSGTVRPAGRARRARLGPARPCPGARRQWLALVRHAAALPGLGDGRAVAPAARAQGAPGRGAGRGVRGARGRARPAGAATGRATDRTRSARKSWRNRARAAGRRVPVFPGGLPCPTGKRPLPARLRPGACSEAKMRHHGAEMRHLCATSMRWAAPCERGDD
jgi:hypothetical protein